MARMNWDKARRIKLEPVCTKYDGKPLKYKYSRSFSQKIIKQLAIKIDIKRTTSIIPWSSDKDWE